MTLFPPRSLIRRSSSWSWPLFLGCWTFFVFWIYFSVHSFDFSFLKMLMGDVRQANATQWLANLKIWAEALVTGGVTFVVLWRVGRKLWMWLRLDSPLGLLKFCFQMGLGILFLNGLWLGLGLNGLWIQSLIGLLEGILVLWAFWDWARDANPGGLGFVLKGPKISFVLIFFLILAFVCLNLAQIILPETYFDALVYHLSTLQSWDFHHGITDLPGNLYAHFPFESELYLWNGFFFFGSQAAKCLSAGIFILTVLFAGAWVGEEGNREAGFLTSACVLFWPLLSTATWATQNDVFLGFFVLLFVYAFVRWQKSQGNLWFIAAGLMGGMAWGAKYTAGLGLFGVFMAGWGISYPWLRDHLKRWVILLLMIFLVLFPWLLKNYVFTGNPLYPYFSHWLGGETLPPVHLTSLLLDNGAPWKTNRSLWKWLIQVLTRDLDKTIAPLLLAFVPLWFLSQRWNKKIFFLLWSSGLYLWMGFLVSHQLRLAIPAIVLLLVAMGFILSSLDSDKIASWSWVVLVFGLLGFISLTRVGVSYYHLGEMWTGWKTQKEYLETMPQTQSYYGLTQAVQNRTAPTDKILIVGDARSLYFSRNFYANSVFDSQLLAGLVQKAKTDRDISLGLEKYGIDDLAVSGAEAQRLALQNSFYYPLNTQEWARLDHFIQHWTDPLFIVGFQGLYHIRSTSITRPKPILDLLLRMKTSKPKS